MATKSVTQVVCLFFLGDIGSVNFSCASTRFKTTIFVMSYIGLSRTILRKADEYN